ncbi:MAG: hypothetical protein FVQ84_02080 [Planctomycetes bacterium]|nr:hypothetical protein [Planctomycetota bacterium]
MDEMTESSRWEKALLQFREVYANTKGQAIVIVGPERSGKSRLLGNMMMHGENEKKFHYDGNIYRVGPNDNPTDVLREIGRWKSGIVIKFQTKTILESLSNSVKEYGDFHRRVIGIDANPTQSIKFGQWWMEIISKLPEKVKFIFTQRPDGILATNKEFMSLPNVVRIDIEASPTSDDGPEGKFKHDTNKTSEEIVEKNNKNSDVDSKAQQFEPANFSDAYEIKGSESETKSDDGIGVGWKGEGFKLKDELIENGGSKYGEGKSGEGQYGGEEGQGGNFKDIGQLSDAFEKFLVVKKGYQKSVRIWQERDGGLDDIGLDIGTIQYLTIDDHEKQKHLAIVGFGLKEDSSTIKMAQQHLDYLHGNAAYADVEGYVVFPVATGLGKFSVIKFDKDGKGYENLLYEDFPTYEELRRKIGTKTEASGDKGGGDEKLNSFRNELTDVGKEVLERLIELIGSESSFSIKAVSSNYINIKLKKPDRVAFQIHRVEDDNSQLGLAIAGWDENDPEIRNKYAIVRRDIERLCGLHDTPQENSWLRGGTKSEARRNFPPYEAKVYIIGPGILEVEDAWVELKGLFSFAMEIAGRGIIEGIVSKISKALKVLGRIATLRSDEVSDVDDLGRETLIDAFADTMIHTDFNNGFTLALMGNWGEGKSSVMEILKRKLKERQKGRFDFALFNAWQYEQTGKTAAGLAQEVVTGLREKNVFKRQLQRVAFAYKENKLSLLILIGFIISPVLLYLLKQNYDLILLTNYLKEKPDLEEFLEDLIKVAYVILPLFGIGIFKKSTEHPLDIQLQTYFKLPDYGEHLGLIPVLKRHITTLCKLKLKRSIRIPFTDRKIGKDRKLLVFVDDLDRCKSDYIAETLDAIRLVMAIPNVIVMICIDHRIAFKAIEAHYRALAEKEDGNRRSSAQVARDYLGKIIQLPVKLEPIKHEKLENYVYGKLFRFAEGEWKQFKELSVADKVALPKEKSSQSGDKDQVPDTSEEGKGKTISARGGGQIFDATTQDGSDKLKLQQNKRQKGRKSDDKKRDDKKIKDRPEEGMEFYRLAGLFEFTNPRQLLRLHNSFQFLKALVGEGENDTLDMLKMLFWQEFLHNWPLKVRGRCMAVLIDKVHTEKVKPMARKVLNKVRDDIVQLFDGENYVELAEFVRIVVLPHNEEGIFDTKEEINEWLEKEKKGEAKRDTSKK